MMWRAWVIFSTLVFSTLFKLFLAHGKAVLNGGEDWAPVGFLFSDDLLNRESWVYFFMEHLNYICIAFILLFKDDTHKFLLWLYFGIVVADLLHFIAVYRDEGIGFNLFKVATYAIALLYFKIKRNA